FVVAVAVAFALAVTVGFAVAVGDGLTVAVAVAFAVAVAVRFGVGVGDGLTVAVAVGLGVRVPVGPGVRVGATAPRLSPRVIPGQSMPLTMGGGLGFGMMAMVWGLLAPAVACGRSPTTCAYQVFAAGPPTTLAATVSSITPFAIGAWKVNLSALPAPKMLI